MSTGLELYDSAKDLTDVFAHEGEDSLDRFERLAAMFYAATGFLAPGKDRAMGGTDQPDGDNLRAIYDDWYAAKVRRVREALTLAAHPAPYEALAALEPYLDAIVCYASDMGEHEPNRLAVNARAALAGAKIEP